MPLRARRRHRLAVAIVAFAAAISAAAAPPGSAAASGACGAATLGVLATVDAQVTTNIYANELAGLEVSDDVAHITANAPLITAVSRGDATATLRAVEKIVYHRTWHIVRLRVLGASGRILADFGGRYTIAPVAGLLRSPAGSQVGSFVMSVQDDVGVTKLETRFVGDPIAIYLHGALVAQLGGASFPPTQPAAASLTLGGVRYGVVTRAYTAFPSGTLHAVLLVRTPPTSLTAATCDAIRAGELGRVARRLTHLLGPLGQHYDGYSYWVHVYTGAEVFVRVPGGKQLASSDGSHPPSLPGAGPFSYEGRSWRVFSFKPRPSTRVYLLVPTA